MSLFGLKKDNCEINTASPPQDVSAQTTEAQPQSVSAQVTVNVLSMYGTWDFYLNGEDIGRTAGRGKVTAAAGSGQKNVLTAIGDKGEFTPPYEFYVESGSHLEVCFDRGRFLSARRIDKAAQPPAEGAKPKIWDWIYWVFLTGYCLGIFFLGLVSILSALVLSFLPVMALLAPRYSNHRAMVNYLADNYPETWSDIAREQYTNPFRGRRDLIFEDACDDPEYLELSKKQKKVFWAQILILCAFFISYFYFVITATS